FHFSSGKSTHLDRLKTIRELWEEYGVMVDTHTADGLKVGLEQRRPGLPLICLETALPAKFEETIVLALGRKPERPASMEGIEELPQKVEVMDADVTTLKAFISTNIQ
ncbi:MAG: threonine synthase, partial [Proteobacteria bacterium]|nr:threonine synthase [Pseudomonadota bacterium]